MLRPADTGRRSPLLCAHGQGRCQPTAPRPRAPFGTRGRGAIALAGSTPGHLHGSSGINIFLVAHRALSEAGGWLRLAESADPVMRTLELVSVDAVINYRETLHQALTD
ncbi:hypothetical protein ACWER6_35135 [Streptomyces sp. NPDC004009]